ncbi:putative GMC oxidoreductase [Lyophyllum shimeji]|uniref:GMC oxidoreductase n=1 Tax=Lyophyllum shimeji TaxID=47721 RepID=A0A9P3PYS3_LYOSH|nr:putative GMC oxidoreductase [Lyophyllum shimeji]
MFRRISLTLALSGIARSILIDLNAASSTGKSVLQATNFDYVRLELSRMGLHVHLTTNRSVDRGGRRDSSKKVLVLEAGRSGVNDSLVTVPQHSFSFIGTDIDWLYNTAPQTHAANQTVNLSSGKASSVKASARARANVPKPDSRRDSAVNGLVWVRGPKEEYDAIEALGNAGWNWNRFYAAMEKAEALNPPSQDLVDQFGFVINPSSLGSAGPVDVSFPNFLPLQHQKFINASVQLGHTFNPDPYGGNNRGVFYSLSSQTKMAVRETSEFAYLDPVLSRSNLVVMYNGALVTKLNVTTIRATANDTQATDSTTVVTASASGVQVSFPDGSLQFAKVKPSTGEVILSAGTVRTPQLLELSGIGDKNILAPLGIDVKVNLPGVGANYEDHTITILTYLLKEPYLSFDALQYDPVLLAQQEELYKQGKGWLTFANSVLNMAPVDKILNSSEIATAKILLQTKPPTIQQDIYQGIRDRVFDVPQVEYLLFNSFSGGPVKLPNRSYVSMAVTHLHPLSRGSIHICSTSINDHPVINPNLLEAEWDRWFLAKATAYARKFFQTPAFQEIFEEEVFPTVADVSTDAEWEQFVKDNINAGYHSVGTASLLPRSKNGVVDTDLKVYGTKNIRVADLSIMPVLLSAHTQPAAYAIGEIAAGLIRGA